MKTYKVTFRNQTTQKATGNTPGEAFESLGRDITELVAVQDPFCADVCIELMGGQRASKKYYTLQPIQKTAKSKTETKKRGSSQKDVLSLKTFNTKQVIVEINAKDPLTVAKYPYLSGDMSYITVTRGKDHIMTVVYDNGKTFAFEWGFSGYTLVAANVGELRKAIVDFIENKCNIPLEYVGGHPSSCSIFYNDNLHSWQLSIDLIEYNNRNNYVNKFSKTANTLEEMIEECSALVEADKWEEGVAQTGIKIWKPVNPIYHIK